VRAFLVLAALIGLTALWLLATTRASPRAPFSITPETRVEQSAADRPGLGSGSGERSAGAHGFTESELEQLSLSENRAMERFLRAEHAWPTSSGSHATRRWNWTDDRNALLYDGECEAEYIDPDIAPSRQRVTAKFDVDLVEQLESHFGYHPDWIRRSYYLHDDRLRAASRSIESRLTQALRAHGIELKEDVIGPHREEIIRLSVPLLRPLAVAIVDQWRDFSNGPMYDRRAEALTSFVQRAIPYELISQLPDGKDRGDLRLPGSTLLHGGDCDSKSLLLATLLRCVQPELPIIMIDMLDGSGVDHTILGAALPAHRCAETLDWNGVTYTLIESTNGFGIGTLPESVTHSQLTDVTIVPSVE
jgi:hypothetical protein